MALRQVKITGTREQLRVLFIELADGLDRYEAGSLRIDGNPDLGLVVQLDESSEGLYATFEERPEVPDE